MATTRSGFDPDRFGKYVAMFDSPFRPEAESAFRLALDELAKDQRRFCDQLIDPSEAKAAKKECARMRDELATVFARCSRQEAEVGELEDTIVRLHKHVALIENGHAAELAEAYRECDRRDAQVGELEAIIDRLHRRMSLGGGDDIFPPDTDDFDGESTSTGEDFEHDFGLRFEPDGGYTESSGNTAAPRPLAYGPMAYWLLLLSFALVYAISCLIVWHPLTTAEWGKASPIFAYVVPAVALISFIVGHRRGFYRTAIGQHFATRLGSRKAMVSGLIYFAGFWYFGLTLWHAVTELPDGHRHPVPTPTEITLQAFLMLSLIVWAIARELRNWGPIGLIVHICGSFNLMVLFFLVEFHCFIWNLSRPPIPEFAYPIWAAALVFLLVWFGFMSRGVTDFILSDEDFTKWITVGTVWIVALCVVVPLFRDTPPVRSHPLTRPMPKPLTPQPRPLFQDFENKALQSSPASHHASFTQEEAPPPAQAEPDETPAKDYGVVAVVFIIVVWWLGTIRKRNRLAKARKDAHTLTAPNVHGNASNLDRSEAKQKRWI